MTYKDRQRARQVLYAAFRNFRRNAFRVDPKGRHWHPLHIAEMLGWCKFSNDCCMITDDGAKELEPYRSEPKPPVVVPCPHCAKPVQVTPL